MNKAMRFAIVVLVGLLWNSDLPAQSKADCLACHGDEGLAVEKNGREVSLFVRGSALGKSVHRRLVCVACHVGFDPDELPHKPKIEPVKCATCHKDAGFKHSFHPEMQRALSKGKEPDPSCKDCHGTHEVVSPKEMGSKFHSSNLSTSCGECHGDVHETFSVSAHGRALQAAVKGAPDCLTCHRHDIAGREEKDLLSHKITQERLCLSCHLDDADVRARTAPSAGFIAAYERSVHGASLLGGDAHAANCVDCHGSHEMRKGIEPASLVHKKNIRETCGKCHSDVAAEFHESIHGIALEKGNNDAPTCTSCHGEHNILRPSDPQSRVAAANISAEVCSPCHTSVKLTEKYGISANRFQTYADSYHGLAMRGGSVEAANCASCHGAHNIRPSKDPTSTVHKANLAVTCGKCHPGANERFAIGSVHVAMTSEEDPLLYWIATLYIILLVSVVGGMFAHNLLDFVKRARRRLMIRRGLIVEEYVGHSLYVRMTLNERLQHGALFTSFFVLVVTGFMLRYPDAWWVVSIRNLSDSVFDLRSLMHRIAGVMMIAASLYHLYYISFTERGRQLVKDLMPKIRDVYDAIAVLKYNLGISPHKPRFGRFSYIEKSEYWALVWGTVIMGATGFVMWFDNTFIGLFTKLGYDVARTIHFYEAWLATLAIVVWHFYYVMFNPDVYPMSLAWVKGTLTEAEMEEEHPLELEEIRRQREEEEDEEGGKEPSRGDSEDRGRGRHVKKL
jgi:predicted CXXCH cytochrome family protein